MKGNFTSRILSPRPLFTIRGFPCVGDVALFTTAPVESDVPEREVRHADPLDTPTGWPAWHRLARLLGRPEPLDSVLALLPDAPPRRFTWRGQVHAVVAGDGPERIHGEWWRRDGEVWAVRDYWLSADVLTTPCASTISHNRR